MVSPIPASRDGFSLKWRVEMIVAKIGAVFTSTVAFRIVVFFTAEM